MGRNAPGLRRTPAVACRPRRDNVVVARVVTERQIQFTLGIDGLPQIDPMYETAHNGFRDQSSGARAVVLAGGKGTRLRPYTAVLPKPLMPVGDGPVLDIVMRQLMAAGFGHVTVATGYLAELIETVLDHRKTNGIVIDYVREAEPLGTVGALALTPGLDEPFLVMNGDVLTDLNYEKLFAAHVASGATATIATTTQEVAVSLGVLECGDELDPDRLTGYVEKPRLHYDVSMGVYCFDPRVVQYIEPGVHLDLPELVLRLIEHGETVKAWRSAAYWIDLGQPEDYERAISDFDEIRHRLLPEEPRLAPAIDP